MSIPRGMLQCTYLVKQRRPQKVLSSTGKFPTNPCIKCALLNSACKMRLVVFEEWDTAQPEAEILSGG